jgi:hypothetical protein
MSFFEVGSLYLVTMDNKHAYLFITRFKQIGTIQGQPYYAVEFLSPRGKIEKTSITESALRNIFVVKKKL